MDIINHTCEDWCHCKKCGGFKMGGVPYGHSCSCEESQPEVLHCPFCKDGLEVARDAFSKAYLALDKRAEALADALENILEDHYDWNKREIGRETLALYKERTK